VTSIYIYIYIYMLYNLFASLTFFFGKWDPGILSPVPSIGIDPDGQLSLQTLCH
jgi:hypothetical protein